MIQMADTSNIANLLSRMGQERRALEREEMQQQEQRLSQQEALYTSQLLRSNPQDRGAIIQQGYAEGVFDDEDLEAFATVDPYEMEGLIVDKLRIDGYGELLPSQYQQGGSGITSYAPTIITKESLDDAGDVLTQDYFSVPIVDKATGQVRTKETPIEGTIKLRSGETPQQKRDRDRAAKLKEKESEFNLRLENETKKKKRIALVKSRAKSESDDESTLRNLESNLPVLYDVVGNLKELGRVATYTKAGRAYDAVARELGFKVPEGATARAKYIATVDNEILPLLKATFGAAFTQKEGESLKATLGDPNLSPEEKNAQLDAFIEQKERQVQGLRDKAAEQGAVDDEYEALKAELGI